MTAFLPLRTPWFAAAFVALLLSACERPQEASPMPTVPGDTERVEEMPTIPQDTTGTSTPDSL